MIPRGFFLYKSLKTIKMRIRLMKIVMFLPCCLIDSIGLFFVLLPLYVICNKKIETKESYLEWLFNDNN